ncbi:MAG: N-acetylmuramoyl-L-alanine amidase [Mangrovicoccus sp.]
MSRALSFLAVLSALLCALSVFGLGPVAVRPAFAAEAAIMDAPRSYWKARRGGLQLRLRLSHGVPYRVAFLENPVRLVLEFEALDLPDAPKTPKPAKGITEQRLYDLVPGVTRLEAELSDPMVLQSAGLRLGPDGQGAELDLALVPSDAVGFAVAVANSPDLTHAILDQPRGAGAHEKLHIVLDPGHGGLDSGAEHGGIREADLVLEFAQELQQLLRDTTDFEVSLTREDDSFVSLRDRMSIARKAEADLMISLHADAVTVGTATGATVHVLGEKDQARASSYLTARMARDDLVQGADLRQTEDAVAAALMDLARSDAAPKSRDFAAALLYSLRELELPLYKKPLKQANFVVLRAPDMASVLFELGFLSNPEDRARLVDPAFRHDLALAVRAALLQWNSQG